MGHLIGQVVGRALGAWDATLPGRHARAWPAHPPWKRQRPQRWITGSSPVMTMGTVGKYAQSSLRKIGEFVRQPTWRFPWLSPIIDCG